MQYGGLAQGLGVGVHPMLSANTPPTSACPAFPINLKLTQAKYNSSEECGLMSLISPCVSFSAAHRTEQTPEKPCENPTFSVTVCTRTAVTFAGLRGG
eukprot:3313089-Rhodomonas_salina.1